MKYIVLDIETDAVGKATELGFYDGVSFVVFEAVSDAIEHILSLPSVSIYAHYGLGFDFALLYTALLKRVNSLSVAMSGSSGVFITLKVAKSTIYLLDSFRLMPASLLSLTKQFNTEVKKRDLEGVMPWNLTKEDRVKYLEDDCISLYQVLQTFWAQIDSNFGLDRAGKQFRTKTLASLSLRIFCDKYTVAGKIFNPCKLQADDEQRSYFGGLVYVNTEHSKLVENVSIYDVNSMYPYIMATTKFPSTYHRSQVSNFVKNSVALWECEYEFFVGIPFVFDSVSRTLSYSGRCIIDTDTFLYIKNRGGSLKILKGFVYERTDFIFKKFVQDCYKMRQEFGKDSAMGYVSKILMNSLYGKFGEKDLKRTLSTIEPPEGDYHVYSSPGVVSIEMFDYESTRYIQHRFPAIASFVTLRSRLMLKKLADLQSEFVYCDTDSLHLVGSPVGLDVGSALGQFKLEFTGNVIYKGKKAYQLYNADGSIAKTVLKGIPSDARRSLDFRDLVGPSEIAVPFSGYTSLLNGIKTSEEFKAVSKKRTFREVDSRLQ